MFNELFALLAPCEKLVLTIAPLGSEHMRVIVAPVVKGHADAGLSLPLVMSGRPEEFDSCFAQALSDYATSRRSLAEQVEATAAVLEAAKATETQRATKALSKANPPKVGKGGGGEPENGDTEDEVDAETGTRASASPVQSSSTNTQTGTDLASLLD